jgi:hypothetical protein
VTPPGIRSRARRGAPILLDVPRIEQPDDVTCGPTCLAQVYRYFGDDRDIRDVIADTPRNADGGTLGVYLGISALQAGFAPTIYSYNLRIFDPTWQALSANDLTAKLKQRRRVVKSKRLRRAITAYVEYLKMGGEVRFAELETGLLVDLLERGRPILTGLSATYLYGTAREHRDEPDDVRGEPVGHFVVVCGYYPRTDRFTVHDPSRHIPFSRTGIYTVEARRLIPAILLGDVTYDANLLVLQRGGRTRSK